MDLGLRDDELSSCVACGLCLPHCPTFRVTGEEALSPRGRIAAMRAVQWEGAEPDVDFVRFMETCVQCRGCEPACPSGVPYGNLVEATRHALADAGLSAPWPTRMAMKVLGHRRLLAGASRLLAVAQRAHLVPRRLGLAPIALRPLPRLRPTGDDVVLFTGCVMDAWMRPVHRATANVLTAAGVGYALPGHQAACCGALHQHAGLARDARDLARRTMASLPGDAPVLVNSAGCGAVMKEYGRILGTPAAATFAARVFDVQEWLAARPERLPPARRPRQAVIVADPCHLRHVQRAHAGVRLVLAPYAEVVELDDDGLCCGAGGAYATTEPTLAGQIRDRKVAAIQRAAAASGAGVVASANPGCAMHLAAAGVTVRHPMEIVAEAIL